MNVCRYLPHKTTPANSTDTYSTIVHIASTDGGKSFDVVACVVHIFIININHVMHHIMNGDVAWGAPLYV